MRRSLLIANDFPPVTSGIATVFYQIWQRLPAEDPLAGSGATWMRNARGGSVFAKLWTEELSHIVVAIGCHNVGFDG